MPTSDLLCVYIITADSLGMGGTVIAFVGFYGMSISSLSLTLTTADFLAIASDGTDGTINWLVCMPTSGLSLCHQCYCSSFPENWVQGVLHCILSSPG